MSAKEWREKLAPARHPWAATAVLVVCALMVVAFGIILNAGHRAAGAQSDYAELGKNIGDVTLIGDDGANVRWGDLQGAPRVVYFGFTHCPDVCPLTVYELTSAMDRIGPAAAPLHIEFVTLDPARDGAATLHAYFSGFSGRVRGLTGDPAALDRVARAYEIKYRKAPQANGDYSIDHTTTAYLIDRTGNVVDVVGYGTEPQTIEKRLRTLLGAPAA